MFRIVLALAALLLPGAAFAQSVADPVTPGYLSSNACLGGIPACFLPTGYIKGYGTLAVTSSSALVSTATAGPNSAVWPTAPTPITFINAGATVIYLCPLGGTCSASVGIPMPAGTQLPVANPSLSATVFDASSGTLVATW